MAANLSIAIKAVDEASKVLKGVADEAEKTGNKISGIGDKAAKGFRGLGVATTGLIGIVGGLGAAAFKLGSDFDSAFDAIRLGTGATGQDLEALKDSFKAVLASGAYSFEETSTAIANFNTYLGLTGKELEDVSKATLNLSKVAGIDLASATNDVSQIFGKWNIATEDMVGTIDKLWRTSQATGVGVDALSKALLSAGPAFQNLGFSIDEAMAYLGKWNREGYSTEVMLSGLSKAAAYFASQGVTDVKGALKDLIAQIASSGDSAEAAQLALEVFGRKAGPELARAIREGAFEVDQYIDAIENGSETVQQAVDDTEDFGEKLTRLRNIIAVQLEPVASKVFDKISEGVTRAAAIIEEQMPRIEKVVGFVTDSFQRIGSFIDEKLVPVIEKAASLIADKLGPAFERLSKSKEAIKALSVALSAVLAVGLVSAAAGAVSLAASFAGILAIAGPIAGVAVAIGAIAAAVYLVYSNWDKLKERFPILQELEDKAKAIAGVIQERVIPALQEFGGDALNGLREFGGFLRDDVLPVVERIGTEIRDKLGSAIQYFSSELLPPIKSIGGSLLSIAETITSRLVPVFKGLVDVAVGVVDTIRSNWGTISDVLSGPFTIAKSVIEGVLKSVVVIIEGILDTIAGIMRVFAALLKGDWSGAWQGIKDTLSGILEMIVDLVRIQLDTIGKVFSGLFDLLVDIVSRLGDAIVDLLKGAFGLAVDVVTGAGERLLSAAKSAFDRMLDAITGVLESVKSGFTSAFESILSFLGSLPSRLLDIARDMGNAIRDGLVSGVKGAIAGIGSIEEQLLGAIKSVINAAIQAINDAIPNSIHIPGLGPLPDIDIDLPDNPIPQLARGGLIQRGGLAIVGERGAEMVVVPAGAAVLPSAIADAVAGVIAGAGTSAPQISIVIQGPVTVGDRGDVDRFANDLGFGISAALQARGAI